MTSCILPQEQGETAVEAAMLYAVYLQDTNGHRRLVGGGMDLSENDANELIQGIVGRHSKPHKVDYDKVGYTLETKERVLREKQIDY